MPKCPKCKEEIDYLYWSEARHFGGDVCLKDGKIYYEEDYNSELLGSDTTYTCPECDEILFEDSVGAESFLINKEENEALKGG